MTMLRSDKIKLATYLGRTIDDLNLIDGVLSFENDEDIVEAVLSKLEKLDAIDEKLDELALQGNAFKVDEIEVKQFEGIMVLKQQGRKHVKTLSQLTSISVFSDYFSSSSLENTLVPTYMRKGM